MNIYGISGLGADERVFQYLNIGQEIIHLPWLVPDSRESLADYVLRMSQKIDSSEEFILLGVSFGGIVAAEISKICPPRATVLISSIETHTEMRWIFRAIGWSGIMSIIPASWMNGPQWVMNWAFGAKNKELLKAIVKDTGIQFTKWAVTRLLNWKNEKAIENAFRINGKKDRLFPITRNYKGTVVQNGGHFMIVDEAKVIEKWITEKIKPIVASIS